ncbi:testis-specific serine/threonine-protein kinase 5-like isoform X2 [Eptesicus fuscus]|uniref:testis-specific serine/threonine-protein kinase 5-like isoform X2 n=1 Tax=Eptesicus fuscus TaxID=29078 RepID=UPI0024044C6F|nr:testis-specific serine/threonine-protein kinase 5-like isoform X2 [Eptesicus fuscus]
MKGNGRRKPDQRTFMAQVRECRDKGYLLSSKKIGSGAFSRVYLAYATQERMQHNPRLASDLRGKRHSMVAIKIVSTAEAPVEFAQKFLPREISSLNATYKHLNVVQLYETYHNSQRAYLVLELAGRGDLLEHINTVSDRRRCPGLEEKEAHRLFWQLVSAVAHCHSSGVVHRDLKCENILLDDQGFLKLTDFGFANQSALKNALLSTFCGSVAYTAPEILMSKKYNGERADLWSLGVILYAMVTGKLPFKERRPRRMLLLMRRGPAFPPGLSPECQDLIRALLQLRPCARPDLQQVAAHRWMLPAPPALFRAVLGAAPENPAEPREDSDPTRPLLQLRRPQQQGTPKSASGPAPQPPGARPSRGAWSASAGVGLQSMAKASPGVGVSRRPPSLWAPSALRSALGHHLVS